MELKVTRPLEIGSYADIPSSGTGLGSSSAFTVALVNAIRTFHGQSSTASFLANLACKIEIDLVGDPIGKQDQYASAFGGINRIQFESNGVAIVLPSKSSIQDIDFLDSCLSAFYLGYVRSASEILKKQNEDINQKQNVRSMLDQMKRLVTPTIESVKNQDAKELGLLISEGWNLKKSIGEQISNISIDEIIEKTMESGALGAKILGAGGGGFLLVCHEPGQREYIKKKLDFLRALDFEICLDGASIVYNDEI